MSGRQWMRYSRWAGVIVYETGFCFPLEMKQSQPFRDIGMSYLSSSESRPQIGIP